MIWIFKWDMDPSSPLCISAYEERGTRRCLKWSLRCHQLLSQAFGRCRQAGWLEVWKQSWKNCVTFLIAFIQGLPHCSAFYCLFTFGQAEVFFFKLFIYLFIYGCVGSSFLCEGFLHLRQVGATPHRGARASHYRGLSCCGAQAPDAQAQ